MKPHSTKFFALSLTVVASLLSACGSTNNRPTYDGVQFKTKAKAVDKKVSRADFVVEVQQASLSLEGARLAAHHAGVQYCIREAGYGTSKIIWDVNPYDTEAQLNLVGGTAVFNGKCDP